MKSNVKTSMKIFMMLLIFGSLMTACKKDEEETKVAVQMTDDPFPMEMVRAAKIGVAKIELKDANGNYFTVFNGNTEVNMVEYTNGATAEVSVNTVPAGTYTEAKITLSNASVELTDGRHFDANVSASLTYNVKINPAVEVAEGETGALLIDMDLSDSFQFQGAMMGGWVNDIADITGLRVFNPDFRAVNLAQTGSIEGQVTDDNGNPVAYAFVEVKYDYDDDGMPESVSTIADANGHYAIIGLPSGSYDMYCEFQDDDADVDNITVTVNHETTVNVTID